MRTLHNFRKRIAGMAFSADGKTLMACARGLWDVAVWNLETSAFEKRDVDGDGPICCLATSPDGKWVGVGTEAAQVFADRSPDFDYHNRQDFSFGGAPPRPRVHGIAFGWTKDRSDCRIAFAAGELCTATLKAAEEAEIVGTSSSVVAVAFSSDGRLLAAVDEGQFALWLRDAWAGEAIDHDGFAQEPRSVCFTADGRTIAVAVATRVVLCAAEDIRARRACAHGARVTQVAGHPMRNLVASAGTDGVVRFWDTDVGKEANAYNWNIGRVTAVCFAPDGLTCAADGEKGQIVVWDVDE